MQRMLFTLALAFCLLPARAVPAAAAPEAALPARIAQAVEAERERQRIPGLAVAVVEGGQVLLARGFGLANVELGVPVDTRTVFQSGSLGKMFAATLVMMLVEDGRLGLDDPLSRFFPEAPAAWAGVTVRQLLTHTSGMPDYTEGVIDLRRDHTEDELVALAFRMQPAFPPGARWEYSNTGYVLVGALVRRVTGRFYGDLLAERIFRPLGMAGARVISEADIVPGRAAGYRLEAGALKNQEWVAPALNTTADGALYLSLEDMLAWNRGIGAGRLLGVGGWAAVFEPVRLADGSTYPYGLGWRVDEAAGAARHHHSGSWQGFKTYFARYLGRDLQIVVLANLAEAEPARVVDAIAALFDPALVVPDPEEPATAGD